MLRRNLFFYLIPVFICLLWATLSHAAGTIQGYVSGPDGVNIVGATIQSPSNSTTTEPPDGLYTMLHPEGVHSFTASASGYISKTINNVAISTDFTTDLDFSLLEMEVKSTYPSLGTLGQSLDNLEIRGGGFDANTRFSILPDTGNAFSEVGQFTDTGLFLTNAVKKVGNIAYVVDLAGSPNPLYVAPPDPEYVGTLYVVDVTNPTNPKKLGSVALPGYGRDVDVSGAYAYVTYGDVDTGDGGLVAVDVSDPADPKLKDSVSLDTAYGVKIQGSTAYVVDGICGTGGPKPEGGNFHAIDISIPDKLGWSWSLSTPFAFCALGLDVQDQLAYVADEWGGLKIVDLDLGSESYKQSINAPLSGDPREFKALKVVGNWVYATVENDGLLIINVTDPLIPTVSGNADTPGLARGIDVVDDVAYVADFVSGLVIFDVHDKSTPVLLGLIDSQGAALDVFVEGSLAYVADDWYGLQMVDVSDPQKATLAGSIASIPGAADILRDGNNLYVTSEDGLHKIDVSTPTSPMQSSFIPLTDVAAQRMVLSADKQTMYTAASSWDSSIDLKIIDLGTLSVTDVAIANGTNKSWSVDVDSNFIYVADGNCDEGRSSGSLWLLDKADPATQYQADLGGCATDVVVDSSTKRAYVTVVDEDPSFDGNDDNGLKIVDVDPTHVTPFLAVTTYLKVVGLVNTEGSPVGVSVAGNYAFVADGWKGLHVVDISDQENPVIDGSTETGHEARDVKIVGNTAYVADFDAGVDVVDVTVTSNPVVVGWVDSPGFANNVAVDSFYAYVADSFAGLTIVPLPYEFPRTLVSEWKATATLPSPPIEGHYRIRAFHATNSNDSVLEGAVSFVTPATASDLLTTKAIIIAGGGDYPTNLIWDETKNYANQAYDNLIYQGYRHEDIRYLTDEPDPLARYGAAATAANNVRTVTKVNLQDAITVWAKSGTGDLLLFMEDHGISQSFLMQGGTTPVYLTADELDYWLDDLQSAMSNTVIVAYDACLSGSFISRMTPPTDKTRVVMTSSGRDQVAYFLAANHSFSSHFWSTFTGRAGSKAQLSLAYVRAAKLMSGYQTAQLDADGDGYPNEPEDFTTLQGFEGSIHAIRRQFSARNRTRPVITAVAQDQTTTGASALLTASDVYDVDKDKITRVWTEIVGPDFHPDPAGQTVLDLPEIPLSGPDTDGVYQLQYDSFTVHGTYIIVYFAEDSSGIYSVPKVSLVTQEDGTTDIPPDQYEDDNSGATANPIIVNHPIPQNHSFHVEGDQDWVKFYGVKDSIYNIRAMNPTIISDPIVTLYNQYGNVIQTSNTAGMSEDESIIGWACPANGTYYVRVTNNSSHSGANVRYKLWVYNPTALTLPELPGAVSGTIISGGSPVGGALISSTGAQPQYTNSSGGFQIFLTAGTHTVTVSCAGYQSISFLVTVSSGQTVGLATKGMNSVPQFANTPATLVKAYEPYSYVPVIIECAGNSYSFSISGKPDWASFSSNNGKLTGTPTVADIGTYSVSITVTDINGASSSKSFAIEVVEGTSGLNSGLLMLLLGQ